MNSFRIERRNGVEGGSSERPKKSFGGHAGREPSGLNLFDGLLAGPREGKGEISRERAALHAKGQISGSHHSVSESAATRPAVRGGLLPTRPGQPCLARME